MNLLLQKTRTVLKMISIGYCFLLLAVSTLSMAQAPSKKARLKKFRKIEDNTKIAQSGDNKQFHSSKKVTVVNKSLRTNKSVVRNSQRKHASYQGDHETGRY